MRAPEELLVALLTSIIVTAAAGRFLVAELQRFGLTARNYRGRRIARPIGVLLPLAATAGWVVLLGAGRGARDTIWVYLAVGWGFALLGLADDLYGNRGAGGFKGHLEALRRRRITTGLIKAVGGLAVGLLAGWGLHLPPAGTVLAASVIALWANLLNLLDLRPGRALKVFVLVGATMWAFSRGAPAWPMWVPLVPPLAGLFLLDLREMGMLGDTGANFLGAIIGLTFVINSSWQVQLAAAIVLAAATVASEKYSFSAAIENIPVLAWLDMIGRRSTIVPRGDKRKA